MANTTKMTKAELIDLLAAHRVAQYPALYAGHEDSARAYWRIHGGKRSDLVTAAVVYGLVPSGAL